MNVHSRVANRALAVATALTMLATHCPPLQAQTALVSPPSMTPRIGLALSGGGARGIAHVGVLKVLDELRVPISCVTGTSMGAIVGATFAAGRTPAEMEKIVLDANWEEIFRDKPPRGEIAVRRKIDDYKTLFAPEFGVKDGALALPKGVLAGVAIESCSTTGACPRRCARACRYPGRCRQSISMGVCSSTAPSPTICRSNRRASSALT